MSLRLNLAHSIHEKQWWLALYIYLSINIINFEYLSTRIESRSINVPSIPGGQKPLGGITSMRKNVNHKHSSRGVRPADGEIARANLYVLRGDNAPARFGHSCIGCFTNLNPCFVCLLRDLWSLNRNEFPSGYTLRGDLGNKWPVIHISDVILFYFFVGISWTKIMLHNQRFFRLFLD